MAPIATQPSAADTPDSSSMPLMSMSTAGRASRSASSGIRLWPPASTLASSSVLSQQFDSFGNGRWRLVLNRRQLHRRDPSIGGNSSPSPPRLISYPNNHGSGNHVTAVAASASPGRNPPMVFTSTSGARSRWRSGR